MGINIKFTALFLLFPQAQRRKIVYGAGLIFNQSGARINSATADDRKPALNIFLLHSACL